MSVVVSSPPAVCMTCGFVFSLPNFMSGGGIISMQGSTTTCQRCRSRAEFLDGTYAIRGNALEAIAGGHLTSSQAERLAAIRDTILKEKHSSTETISDDVVEAIKSVSPELGGIVEQLKKGQLGIAFLLFVLFLWLRSCDTESGGINIDLSQHNQSFTNVTNVTNVTNAAAEKSPNSDKPEQKQARADTDATGNGTKTK